MKHIFYPPLYDLFKNYCNSGPKYDGRKLSLNSNSEKVYSRVYFQTYCLPSFNYYHQLFYKDGVKTIPINIMELLTARGLAYWAMDSGSKKGSGFIFCTDSYTLEDVQLLVKVLRDKFNLDATIQIGSNSKNYRIYIKADSMDNFRKLLSIH